MDCVTIDVRRVGWPGVAVGICERIGCAVTRVSDVEIACSRAEDAIIVAKAVDCATFSLSRVCADEVEQYLVVSPDVVWLNEDNDFSQDIEILSNTDWIIE